MSCGPNLAMGMRIAGAHHGAAVFEDLHMLDPGARPQIVELIDPQIDHGPEFAQAHARDGEVVARRKTSDAADSALRTGDQQIVVVDPYFLRVGEERGVIIVEGEGAGVLRIARTASAGIPRTQIAVWVEMGRILEWGLFYLSLPGPLRAMGRDDDPLLGQGIVASVGRVLELIEIHASVRIGQKYS